MNIGTLRFISKLLRQLRLRHVKNLKPQINSLNLDFEYIYLSSLQKKNRNCRKTAIFYEWQYFYDKVGSCFIEIIPR